ncbi:MAG: hypothetical protein CSA05_00355 [Bacteroidia bacterium]|nr:MAG: hypothetical protein CSB01_01050 [Bacteroidia bacterium]PIE86459.1 MAG: hypothetical protein CSA05_00355 [Bacteroidia bacterium]
MYKKILFSLIFFVSDFPDFRTRRSGKQQNKSHSQAQAHKSPTPLLQYISDSVRKSVDKTTKNACLYFAKKTINAHKYRRYQFDYSL